MNLDQLKQILIENNAPVLKFLQDGVTSEYVTDKAGSIDLDFPKELVELYKWKNGTRLGFEKLGLYQIFPLGILYSLEKAIAVYSGRVNKDEYWKNKMSPIFGDGGGAFFLIDLDNDSPTYQQLFYYCLNDTDFDGIISFFDSLESAVTTIIECYRQKVFHFEPDEDKDLMIDFTMKGYRKIGKDLNPKSQFWPLYY